MEKTKIQELYENEKSKKFVNHLIQAYLPLHKPKKVFSFNAKDNKKCSVCGQPLISIDRVLELYHQNNKEITNSFMERIKKELNDEEISEENPLHNLLNGRVLAWQGEQTDTMLCFKCIEDTLALMQNGILNDDKNMIWLSNKMRRAESLNTFNESPHLDNTEKEKAKQIHKKAEKKKKVTFGDLQELQDLKKKMENENK